MNPNGVAFIGGGNMAEAILAGLVKSGRVPADAVVVSEPVAERREFLGRTYGVTCVAGNAEAVQRCRTVVLAVKPFLLDEVREAIAAVFAEGQILVSILAGATRARLGAAFGHSDRMVRVMPNLPAQVGRGVSAVTFPDAMSGDDRDWVKTILRSVGHVVEVEEPLQDVVTAVSGSGPGFVFALVDGWIRAAVNAGLDADTARTLVVETVAGAAEVLTRREDAPDELVRKVATPGGTTEAGLTVLKAGELDSLWSEALQAARQRSVELAS